MPSNEASRLGRSRCTVGSQPSVRDAVHGPNHATALTGDLSPQGTPVVISARLGRWRCRNQECNRRIFTERVPGLAAPFARRTARLAGIVRLLGHSAGGGASERLRRRLGMPVSDTTILTVLKKHAGARCERGAPAVVRVAGFDDWAWRKGHNYGTIIVDLERREVVDVTLYETGV